MEEKRKLRYIDKYPECRGCPVEKYCGTMISSRRLCNSYELNTKKNGDNSDNNRNTKYYTVYS